MVKHVGVIAAAAALIMSTPSAATTKADVESRFSHHVFFWLKDRGNLEDRAKLVACLQRLAHAPMIRRYQIGIPAGTPRDVVDNSYDVSWLIFFDGKADQDAYQAAPIHLRFVEDCSRLWEQVAVYDNVLAP